MNRTCIRVQTRCVATQTPQGILANALQEARGKTARCGLAMGATNGDRTQDANPTRETFTTRQDRNARLTRRDEFGVVSLHGGAIDERIARRQVRRIVILLHMDVVPFKEFGPRRRDVAVATGHLPTFQVEHPSNSRGADTTDAHDMDTFGRE